MPNCRNQNSWLSNPHPEPNVFDVHHSASRTLTTNQPSPAGARPEPKSSSRASGIARVYGVLRVTANGSDAVARTISGKSQTPENGVNKPNSLPLVATGCR